MDDKIVEVVAREIGPTIRASILRGNACTHEEIDAVISGFARAAIAAYEAAQDEKIYEDHCVATTTRMTADEARELYRGLGNMRLATVGEKRIAELEAALKPFADLAEYIDEHCPGAPDNDETGVWISDLRRARAALAPDKA